MSYKKITHLERESVYAEGKLAFDEHKRRDYNPYAASNLTLTVSWWHGWDTAEEEESKSESQRLPLHERPI
jgi:hypothetical protein